VFDKNGFLHIDGQFANVFDVIADALQIFGDETAVAPDELISPRPATSFPSN
jgi:hypothetical protein